MKTISDIHQECPVTKTLKIIGSKWSMLIIHNLCDRTLRFGQLQKALPGISPKTLSDRLDELEKAGIVSRQVFPEIPLHVEYSLTPKGQSLKSVFEKMGEWGELN